MRWIELLGGQSSGGDGPLQISPPQNRAETSTIGPAKIGDQFIRGGIIDLRGDSIHARLPVERFPQRRRNELVLFKSEESRQPAGIKEIQRCPKLGHVPQRQPPSVPQIRSRFERTVRLCIIESRQLSRILRGAVERQIISPSVVAVREREAPVIPAFDRNLSNAPQTRRQPISERAFLRERAHFKARAIRNAACSRKSRSFSVNAPSFSLSTSISPTTLPDSVITGTTISDCVLPKVGR